MKLLFGILMIFSFSALSAQDKKAEKKYDMKTYYLVFLKKGLTRNQDSLTVAKIQEGHMTHLTKMHETGKMCIAGPMMDDGDIRGICVYYTNTQEEAEKLANSDPAVRAGRLMVEIHPWYAAKGSKLE